MLERLTAKRIHSADDIVPHLKPHKYPARKGEYGMVMHVGGGDWPMPYSVFEHPKYFANITSLKGSDKAIKRMSHQLRSVTDKENDIKLHRLEIGYYENADTDPDNIILFQEELLRGGYVEPIFAAATGLKRYLNTEVHDTTHIERRWTEISDQENQQRLDEERALVAIWHDIEENGPLLSRTISNHEGGALQRPSDG